MNFDGFVKSNLKNAWIKEPGIQLYVRRSLPTRGTDFDLANMKALVKGGGSLTRFLDKYEPQYSFYVENVLNRRLEQYLVRRGYKKIDWVNHSYIKRSEK